MNEPRRFVYSLKLHTGQLVHAEGSSPEEAMAEAHVKPEAVRRHMPVKIVRTEEEKAASYARIEAMKAKLKEREEL